MTDKEGNWTKVNRDNSIQMSRLVGRRTVARAAQSKVRRSRVTSSVEHPSPAEEFRVRSLREFDALSVAASVEGTLQCQGQLYNAMIVRVVSNELENVRVDANHCHGLMTVKTNVATEAVEVVP